jgi:hypothetical protein
MTTRHETDAECPNHVCWRLFFGQGSGSIARQGNGIVRAGMPDMGDDF